MTGLFFFKIIQSFIHILEVNTLIVETESKYYVVKCVLGNFQFNLGKVIRNPIVY